MVEASCYTVTFSHRNSVTLLRFQDDLIKFWKLQDGRQAVIAENAHTILAAAAVQFNEVIITNYS